MYPFDEKNTYKLIRQANEKNIWVLAAYLLLLLGRVYDRVFLYLSYFCGVRCDIYSTRYSHATDLDLEIFIWDECRKKCIEMERDEMAGKHNHNQYQNLWFRSSENIRWCSMYVKSAGCRKKKSLQCMMTQWYFRDLHSARVNLSINHRMNVSLSRKSSSLLFFRNSLTRLIISLQYTWIECKSSSSYFQSSLISFIDFSFSLCELIFPCESETLDCNIYQLYFFYVYNMIFFCQQTREKCKKMAFRKPNSNLIIIRTTINFHLDYKAPINNLIKALK